MDSQDGDIDGDDVLNANGLVESCKAGATSTSNTGIWVVSRLGRRRCRRADQRRR